MKGIGGEGGFHWSGYFLSLYCHCRSLNVLSALFFSFLLGTARRGQGELPWAAGGLHEVAANGERERTVYGIAMIQ